MQSVTVYDVRYKQYVNRGSIHERLNFVSIATFWNKEDADKLACQPNHHVIPVTLPEDEAFRICER